MHPQELFTQRGQASIGIVIAVAILLGIVYWMSTHSLSQVPPIENYPGAGTSTVPSNENPVFMPPFSKGGDKLFCIQVITPAQNPETGECREFGTPCDVPNGWMVNGCTPDGSSMPMLSP